MILKIIIAILFFALAGLCKGIMDTLWFHYGTSVFADKKALYWDPKISWRNKYKNGDSKQGARFPGSTTIFVGLTDGWHLFQLFNLACHRSALVVLGTIFFTFSDAFWTNTASWMVVWIALIFVHSAGFYLTYSVLAKKKIT